MQIILAILLLVSIAQARIVECRSGPNGQVCWALKYPVGQVPTGGTQELQAVASGLAFNHPVYLNAYARRRKERETDLSTVQTDANQWVSNSAIFAAGTATFYRGIGLVCDRDGTPGYQDPRTEDTSCEVAGANQDCIVAAVPASWATWATAEVSNSSSGDRYETTIRDTQNRYIQTCYQKGNTDTDVTFRGQTLRDGSLKCDVTVDKLADIGSWTPLQPLLNVWTAAGTTVCPAEKQRIGIQTWTFSGAASTRLAGAEFSLDAATKLTWVTTATCTYKDASTVVGTVVADARLVSNPFADWKGVTLTSSISRINWQFSCPRSNGADTNFLQKIYWDPTTEITPSSVTVSASFLSVSTLLVALLVFLAATL